jgi:CRP-like cAMP-binding protein
MTWLSACKIFCQPPDRRSKIHFIFHKSCRWCELSLLLFMGNKQSSTSTTTKNNNNMGCSESKQQTTSSSGPSSSTVARNLASRAAAGGGAAVDVVVQKSMMPKKQQQQQQQQQDRAHHLKNIFASPLGEVADNYKPPSYSKTKSEQEFLKTAVQANFVFSSVDSKKMQIIINAFEPTSVEKESAIIKQHEEGDYFYVLKSGTARFEVDGATVGQAKEGDSFGELALLYKAPRAASVIATSSPCKLYRLDQRTFRTILQSQTQQADSKKRELLKNISFLSELDEHDLNKLVQALTPRPFKKNEVLVKKGTQGDTFFVIQEGGVKVTNISIGGAKYEDQTLASGDYFGERALITSEPRSANCVATSDGIALTVDAETFQLVMGDFKRLVLKASDKRKLAAIPKFSSLLPADLTTLATSIAEKTYKKGDIIVKEAEENVSAVLYLVRDEGKIQVTSTSKKYSQTIESGGYFAEELNQLKKYEPTLTSAYTIKAVSDTTVGVLTASECRVLFDVAAIGSIRNKPPKKDAHQNIQYKDLKKHKILGAGTFGQVWLVSVKSPSGGGRTAYALKIQSKYDLVENDMAKGVVQEKNIMSELDHPFIIKLVNTYQDKQRVYMLVQLVQGGELYSVLHRPRSDGVPESQAKFYGATILAGLSYMHRRNIIYRDLKVSSLIHF